MLGHSYDATSRSAASIARRTAPRPGRRCCFETIVPAPSTCRWIPKNPDVLLRSALAGVSHAVVDGKRRPWQRLVQVNRWRHDLDRDHEERRDCRSGLWGRVGVSVSGADSNRVYAIIENDSGGVFVSDDAGATWRKTNEDRNLRQRAFYYTHIVADTVEKDTVYVLNVQFFKSTDGGKTFPTRNRFACRTATTTTCGSPRTDNKRMVQANDGGGNVSVNGGQHLVRPGLCDRPVLQRLHDASRAVSRVRRAAGQQHGLRRQPEQPRRGRGQPAADLLRRRRRRERLHRARSEGHGGVLRRQLRRLPEPTRSRHRAAARDPHLSQQPDGVVVGRYQGTLPVDVPDRVLAHRSATSLRLVAACVANDERWAALGEDQPEPHAVRPQDNAGVGRADHQGSNRRRNLCRDLHDRAVAPGRQHHLDRIGRRLGARDARRRQDLGPRDATRSARLHAHQPDRSVAAPERRRLSRRQSLSARRSAPLRLQDGGLRQDVAEDRHRHSGQRLSAHDP